MSKKAKAGFIIKLEAILNNSQLNKVIAWNSSGDSFIIYDPQFLEQFVLNSYFRHKKINSFIRLLNMYGFHKSRSYKLWMEFHHPYFKKDMPEDYILIDRRKSSDIQIKQEIKMQSNIQLQNDCFLNYNQPHIETTSLSLIPSQQDISYLRFRLSQSEMTIQLDESLTSLQHIDLDSFYFEQKEEKDEYSVKQEVQTQQKQKMATYSDEIQSMLSTLPQFYQYSF